MKTLSVTLDAATEERIGCVISGLGDHACRSNVLRRAVAVLDEQIKRAAGDPAREAKERTEFTHFLAHPGPPHRQGGRRS